MPSCMVAMRMGDHRQRHLAPRIESQIASGKMDAIPQTDLHAYAFASGNSCQLVV